MSEAKLRELMNERSEKGSGIHITLPRDYKEEAAIRRERQEKRERKADLIDQKLAENAAMFEVWERQKAIERYREQRKRLFNIPNFEFYEHEQVTREREIRTYKPYHKLNLPDKTYLQFRSSSLYPIEGHFALVLRDGTEFRKGVRLERVSLWNGNDEDLTPESQEYLEKAINDLVKSVFEYFDEKKRQKKALDSERKKIEEDMLQELFKNIPDFELTEVYESDERGVKLAYTPKRELVKFPEDGDLTLFIFTEMDTILSKGRSKDIEIKLGFRDKVYVLHIYIRVHEWDWEIFWKAKTRIDNDIIAISKVANGEVTDEEPPKVHYEVRNRVSKEIRERNKERMRRKWRPSN